ncbi:hypothetical protein AVEN_10379-2-1, partial [Araneus ventricosus]
RKSVSRTRKNNKTNGNRIIRAGSEFAKREEKGAEQPFVMMPQNIIHRDCFQYACVWRSKVKN